MTDHERKMIEAYIPHEPDPDLEDGEYYVMDTGGRVQKVRVTDILPGRLGEEETYGVVQVSSGRRIDAGYGDFLKGFPLSDLYDNKQDCKDHTHGCYSGWEYLRKLQEEERDA